MPPNSSSALPNLEKMSGRDSLRILRTLGISRASVTCRHCQARLTCNARIIRDHLQLCVSANLVTVANSEEFLRNRSSGSTFGMSTTTTLATAASSTANNNSTRRNVTKAPVAEKTSTTTMTTTTAAAAATLPRYTLDVQEPAKELLKPLQVPQRILTGPGPSNCSQRVLRALQQQVLGHMHPEMFQLLDEIKSGLRYIFQTTNKLTLAISASGHSGMEAAIGNLLERGEKILIVKAGMWGERAADMAVRLGIHVELLESELGVALELEKLEEAVKRCRPKAVFLAHSESSTGLRQPLEGIGDTVHRYGALLIVDTVASLGAEPFFADAWGVDAVYTGSQKVLGAPSGITPISFSPLAEWKIRSRQTPVPVFYWDMTLLGRYWNCFGADSGTRPYHHTVSATLVYGLREALAQLAEEGLEASWARHAAVTDKFHEALRKRGYELFVENAEHRLHTVTAIVLPKGVDPTLVTRYALERYNVEISGGLGPTAGKILRVGLMGMNATPGHVDLVLRTLDEGIRYAKSQLNSNL